MRASFACLTRFTKRFAGDEGGAVTVEAVLWIPFFFFILMLITDASLAFFSKAQAYRIIENGNRAFATSKIATAPLTAAWIEAEFLDQFTRADADSVRTTTTPFPLSGTVASSLSYPAKDVVLFNTLGVLGGWEISVQAQQYVERVL